MKRINSEEDDSEEDDNLSEVIIDNLDEKW